MKTTTVGWMAAVLAGALTIQCCAQTGGVQGQAPGAAPRDTVAVLVPAAAPQAGTAISEDADGKPVVTADTKDKFDAVATAVRQQMKPGGRFAFVDAKGRATVDGRLDDMTGLFNQYGSFDKMGPAAKDRIMNDQNAINEVLARYDSNRLICRNEMPVGSHLPKRVCQTLGEIQNEQNETRRLLRHNQMRVSENPAALESGGGH